MKFTNDNREYHDLINDNIKTNKLIDFTNIEKNSNTSVICEPVINASSEDIDTIRAQLFNNDEDEVKVKLSNKHVIIECFGKSLTIKQLNGLGPDKMIGDEIINFALNMNMYRNLELYRDRIAADPEDPEAKPSYYMPTEFFEALLFTDDDSFRYENVERWTVSAWQRNPTEGIFALDKIYIPMSRKLAVKSRIQQRFLAVVCMSKKEIIVLDMDSEFDSKNIAGVIMHWLMAEAGAHLVSFVNPREWKLRKYPELTDGYRSYWDESEEASGVASGVFLLHAVDAISLGKFDSSVDMTVYRKRIFDAAVLGRLDVFQEDILVNNRSSESTTESPSYSFPYEALNDIIFASSTSLPELDEPDLDLRHFSNKLVLKYIETLEKNSPEFCGCYQYLYDLYLRNLMNARQSVIAKEDLYALVVNDNDTLAESNMAKNILFKYGMSFLEYPTYEYIWWTMKAAVATRRELLKTHQAEIAAAKVQKKREEKEMRRQLQQGKNIRCICRVNIIYCLFTSSSMILL